MFGNITFYTVLYNISVANFGDFAKIFVNLSMTQHWPDSAESVTAVKEENDASKCFSIFAQEFIS